MINISVVSYLNTLPFIFGLKKTDIIHQIKLNLDYPALCAKKLLSNEVDIALAPVSILTKHDNLNIISDYCIGSDGEVDTVCLFSNSPIENIDTIYLDYHSKTSVQLLKVLLKEYWLSNAKLVKLNDHDALILKTNEAELVIGDRAFQKKKLYNHTYDLSLVWKKMTGMPFVFACWMTNKELDKFFLESFNFALSSGVDEIEYVIRNTQDSFSHRGASIRDYLINKISYTFDNNKKQSLSIFLDKIKDLDSPE